jgi:pimeloyl-ACP methyl ester carboxylesterase
MKIPRPDLPPIWRETRIGLELAGLMRHPVWRGADVADGDGQPVLLISGLLAGDPSLKVMAGWLKRNGYQPCRAGIASNVDCSERSLGRLERRLELLSQRTGRKVAIIGHSRGGGFARVLAVRRPDLVSGIVTLGSPLIGPLSIHPLIHAQVLAVGAVGTLGAPGLMRQSCLRGDCCTKFWEQHRGPFPKDVGFISIYSKSDGIVKWRSCLDPLAEHVEVSASHIGMAVNGGTYAAIAASLEAFPRVAAGKRARSTKKPKRTLRVAA